MVSLCSYGFSFFLWVFQGWSFYSVTQNGLENSVQAGVKHSDPLLPHPPVLGLQAQATMSSSIVY